MMIAVVGGEENNDDRYFKKDCRRHLSTRQSAAKTTAVV